METIDYSPSLIIVNTDQLPKGTGAKFLLALKDGERFIAHSWKRTAPKTIKAGYVLIKFTTKRKPKHD